MKKIAFTTILLLGIIITSCKKDDNKRVGIPKVLVFSKTSGFVHESIPNGIKAIQKLGAENNFIIDTTSNSEFFSEQSLKNYSTIIFLNTSGDVLDYKQEAIFERYIQAGGSFVGVHGASDTEFDWNWYGKLVGGYFDGHPPIQDAKYNILIPDFPATNFFISDTWSHTDEIYNFKNLNPDVNVIMSVDETSYEGGKNGESHPISWYHEYDGGRSFYTALGHVEENYSDENFLNHLLGGIKYAIGENTKLDYTKVTTEIPEDADRFTKKQLSLGEFYEPTEMTILPNLDVLVAQRRGEIMLYKAATGKLSQVGFLDVYFKTSLLTIRVNAEEGLLGLQKDPNFEKNNWIYAFYSPTGDKWVNRLSRFKFTNDVFDVDSEQIILEVGSQREICCHTGGSIAFGADGLLYLSTGDNSTPFNERNAKYRNNGFAPLNELEGKQQYDARRSSGNTNDLRGKIIRIKMNDDGSYEIPDGNLYPVGTAKTRPEIYTMGHRNPYRISVDQKNGYVYWGDVGPDAKKDSLDTRGPKGYDEVNQARKAGNFGWPLFIGNNFPYHEYNYATGEIGPAFDVKNPINNSVNNTGLKELPEAMPAFIWYPYDISHDFPQVATGGRNAMAGPVYYTDLYPKETALPEYYNGKLIIYDWIRGWMKAITLLPNGDFGKMEPFASEIKVNSLIDMEVAHNGRIYLLEYGSGWFTQNKNSGLSYIEYNGGNRPPIIEGLEVDITSGKLPLTVNATVNARDREEDKITYKWDMGNGEIKNTDTPTLNYTYKEAGEYKISVEVADTSDEIVKSEIVNIYAGNTKPDINLTVDASSFVPGNPINYKVEVTDAEEDTINTSNIFVSVDYMEGFDKVAMSMGHQEASATITGKALTQSMDCKICHKEAAASIGPNYMDISKKYQNDKNAIPYLKNKLLAGGSGAWGEVSMPAHPSLTKQELTQITSWIMSLADTSPERKSLPAKGSIVPKKGDNNNFMVITASYTDNGANGVKPLTGVKTVTLPMTE